MSSVFAVVSVCRSVYFARRKKKEKGNRRKRSLIALPSVSELHARRHSRPEATLLYRGKRRREVARHGCGLRHRLGVLGENVGRHAHGEVPISSVGRTVWTTGVAGCGGQGHALLAGYSESVGFFRSVVTARVLSFVFGVDGCDGGGVYPGQHIVLETGFREMRVGHLDKSVRVWCQWWLANVANTRPYSSLPISPSRYFSSIWRTK